MSGAPSDEGGNELPAPRRLSKGAFAVAVAVLLFFVAMIVVLIVQVKTDETTWARLAWLLSSVEAMAFGAAGAIFGASVQRERAVAAEKRADENERDAVAGRTLAETIKVGAKSPGSGPGSGPAFDIAMPPGAEGGAATGSGGPRPPRPPEEPYVDLARRLFPD